MNHFVSLPAKISTAQFGTPTCELITTKLQGCKREGNFLRGEVPGAQVLNWQAATGICHRTCRFSADPVSPTRRRYAAAPLSGDVAPSAVAWRIARLAKARYSCVYTARSLAGADLELTRLGEGDFSQSGTVTTFLVVSYPFWTIRFGRADRNRLDA